MKIVTKHPLVFAVSLMATVAAGWGCKNFLDKASEPLGTLDQNTLLNKAGVEGSLLSAYRILDCTSQFSANWGCAASNWVWGSVTSDEAYKGSEATDQPPIDDIEQYHWATGKSEDYLNVKWGQVYEGVSRANATLRLLKQVQTASPSEISDADAKGITGEALFLRAHYHFEAWRMWGNVPYYREDDTTFKKPNLQADAVVTEILKDLADAEAALEATKATGPRNGQKGRADWWTARAYEGRVQAYAGKWSDALTTLTEVKTAGPYALETSFDKVWTGYADEANGKETIWAYQASSNDGETNGNNANYGERLNFPHSGSPFGCCGFHQPSQNLVNYFAVDANGLPMALSNPNWNANNANFTAGNPQAVDPRLDWTVGRDGVPYKDWGKHAPGWIRAPAYGGTYSPKKNAHEKTSGAESSVGWVPTQLNSVNIHIFRYADLLLLLAEAEVEVGSLENARKIVNDIRTRAGVTAQGPGVDAAGAANRALIAVPIDDPSITWATYRIGTYNSVWTDQAQARDRVRAERHLELAMEGQRFFDLRRWGIAAQTLNDYIAVEKNRRSQLGNAETFTDRHKYYPIPAIQIELSKSNGQNTLVQNPGW